jgi:DNA polymerase-3 subunit gamma/tau
MLSLPIKYRPKSFDDLTEQTSIKLILEEQVKTKTFKNAYLFVGGAGTGKTTSARILANMINNGVGKPFEIDAASNNGVDNVRSIIEQAQSRSLEAPYKVFILDEVHMFSKSAWNAMLKLLEEPPSKTIFIMCTTETDNILPTILSRVQRFDFNRISFDGIVARLKYIVDEETVLGELKANTEVDDEALEYIAKVADGGMRDAITLLDKCLSFSNNLTIKEVTEVLGTVNYKEMFDLTDSLLTRDTINAIDQIDKIYNRGVDLKQFIKLYQDFLADILMYVQTESYTYINIPTTYQIDYVLEEVETINKIFSEIININAEIKRQQNPRYYIRAKFLTLGV